MERQTEDQHAGRELHVGMIGQCTCMMSYAGTTRPLCPQHGSNWLDTRIFAVPELIIDAALADNSNDDPPDSDKPYQFKSNGTGLTAKKAYLNQLQKDLDDFLGLRQPRHPEPRPEPDLRDALVTIIKNLTPMQRQALQDAVMSMPKPHIQD